jgi:hypothetical protein
MQFQFVFSFQQPRPHEAGGKYAQGIIVRRYKKDSAITIRVELTANHRGYFEFRLCPNNAPRHAGTQACLDKYVLRRAKFAGLSDEQSHETRYYPAAGNKVCKKSIWYLHIITCSVNCCISCVQNTTPYVSYIFS